MNGADLIIKCLEKEAVDVVFGYPGVAICPFYNSILESDIKPVLIRTEQNAAHAANGLARVTGKVGVCAVTSGPGATNAITGIATAFADSIPLICITGQVETSQLGSDVFQESDITGAAESFVKYSYLVKNAEDIPRIMKEAFYLANTGRKGPVLIDIPIDVQNQTVSKFRYPEEIKMRSYKPTVKGNMVQIHKVAKELEKAKNPVICVGGGVFLSEAQEEVREFVRKHQIPVVCTMMGIGVFPTEDPLFFGTVGNNGKPYANRALKEADLLIVVGARLADRAISNPNNLMKNKTLVHIDIDPCEIGKNAGAGIPLVGDAKHIFEDLCNEEIECDYSLWNETLNSYKESMPKNRNPKTEFVDPAEFIRKLSYAMEDNAVYVADVGQNQIWSCDYHVVKKGRYLTSGGMGTMGYSIPAAMGAKVGCPDKQVVAVCGDGAFQMSMMELATMQQYGIEVKIVVLRNNVLGMVKQYQHFTYKDNFSMIDLGETPNLEKIAQAYNMPFIRLRDMEDADSAIEQLLTTKGSVLMECIIDPADLV